MCWCWWITAAIDNKLLLPLTLLNVKFIFDLLVNKDKRNALLLTFYGKNVFDAIIRLPIVNLFN